MFNRPDGVVADTQRRMNSSLLPLLSSQAPWKQPSTTYFKFLTQDLTSIVSIGVLLKWRVLLHRQRKPRRQ